MLATLGLSSLTELIDQVVPAAIRDGHELALPRGLSEAETLARLRALADRNQVLTSLIGLGYADTVTPTVILRNVLENPAWYTAYTPYQPEISQGRLEALLNFQTMVCDLTGMELANASLLDEATAAAEAMAMSHRLNPKAGTVFVVDQDCHPQTLAVVATRARPLGLEVVTRAVDRLTARRRPAGRDLRRAGPVPGLQRRGPRPRRADRGRARGGGAGHGGRRPAGPGAAAPARGDRRRHRGRVVAALRGAAGLRRSPRRLHRHPRCPQAHPAGAPGRGVGGRRRAPGLPAHAPDPRAAHPPGEGHQQHLHRPGAVGGHGRPVRHLPRPRRARPASPRGSTASPPSWPPDSTTTTWRWWTTASSTPSPCGCRAGPRRCWPRPASAGSTCARSTPTPWRSAWTRPPAATWSSRCGPRSACRPRSTSWTPRCWPSPRTSRGTWSASTPILTHPVFHQHRSETAMLRYLRRLADRDLALDRTMIPLGSCTMKLNATTEMIPVTWPEFGSIHPFAPSDQTTGYRELIAELEGWLAEITGYDAVSVQPNAGSQGELAGLLAIQAFHASRSERPPPDLPHPGLGPRHQRGQRGHGRPGRGGGGLRRPGQRRPGRPGGQAGGPRVRAVVPHGHLPVHPRRVRGGHHRHLRRRPRPRGPGLPGRRQPQRPGRRGPAGPVRGRRVAPQPAQDLLHPPRGRRPGRGPGGGARPPGPVPAQPPAGGRGRPRPPAPAPSRPRPGARPASCPSRGPTSRSWAATG